MHNIEKELKIFYKDIKLKDLYSVKNEKKNKQEEILDLLKIEPPYHFFIETCLNNDTEINIKFTVRPDFPFNIPISKINNMDIYDEYIKKYKIPPPHISIDGHICISDREDIIINYKNPEGVLRYTILHSFKIAIDGYLENNTKDFLDEFDVHIFNKSILNTKGFICINLDMESIEGDRVYISKINGSENHYQITDKSLNNTSKRTLFIKLEESLNFPLPETNIELYNTLKNSNPGVLKKYVTYLKRHETTEEVILFSMKSNNNQLIYFGVKHKVPIIKGKDSKKGYRFSSSKEDSITYIPVFDISINKIESRIEGLQKINQPVSIIGCGSLGSFASEALLDLGVTNFILIDDDILMPENIIRHIGTSEDIMIPKVKVIEKYLLNKKSYIDIISKQSDIHRILDDTLLRDQLLNNKNIKFYATGNKSVNNRILNLINKDSVQGTNIFLWVEPYLYAGHCMIINNPICLEKIYDENNKFKYRVIVDNRNFKKREAGCGANYAIYSGFDTKKFIYDIFNRIKELIYSGDISKGNRVITWTGNLTKARKEGIELSNKYITHEGKSIEEVII